MPQSPGRFYWGDRTRMKTQGYAWVTAPPDADIVVQNGLVRLGESETTTYFAFASPLPAIATAFKSSLGGYLRGTPDARAVTKIGVNLAWMLRNIGWQPAIRAVEGTDSNGFFVSARRSDNRGDLPDLAHVQAVEIGVESRITRVDDAFNLRVADVASEFDMVAQAMEHVFHLVSPFITEQSDHVTEGKQIE